MPAEKINLRTLAWWNRQPTLWSHSCPVIKVVPSEDEADILRINPLSIEPLNLDFDGDTAVKRRGI